MTPPIRQSSMPALLSEIITRSRLPTFSASACVFSSCAWPSVMRELAFEAR